MNLSPRDRRRTFLEVTAIKPLLSHARKGNFRIARSVRRPALLVALMAAILGGSLISRSAPSKSTPKPSLPKQAAQTPLPNVASPAQAPASAVSAPDPSISVKVPPAPKPPDIHASSAILIDAISGQVLYERNADVPHPMASTTKIMTALLLCEHLPDNAVVTASRYAASIRESSMHIKAGEKITVHDLLRAILLRSANDGCVAAAERVAGSEAAFVQMMNDRARSLGCLNTHFVNPHGLHDPDHYTTARDLATIARAAMQNPRFRAVCCIQKCRITRSINKRDVSMRNHSHFLGYYPGADGVKTGYTVPAGHCYVGSATHQGWELISVVLHSPSYVKETAAMMHFGFTHFEPHVVALPGAGYGVCPVQDGVPPAVSAVTAGKVQVVLRKGETTPIQSQTRILTLHAPLAAGAQVGALDAMIGSKVICSTSLVAAAAVAAQPPPAVHAARGGSNASRVLIAGSILALCLVSLRYGSRVTAFAKSARRRGRRLAKSLRGDDLPG